MFMQPNWSEFRQTFLLLCVCLLTETAEAFKLVHTFTKTNTLA